MRPFAKLTLPAKLKRIKYWFVNWKRWWISRTIDTILYYVRTHTYNRYHIINIKSPANGYRFGWIDRDHALFLAMFRILCDFVERELFAQSSTPSVAGIKLSHKKALEQTIAQHGEKSWEYEVNKRQFDAVDKVLELYWWFKFEHPTLIKDDDWDEAYEIETRKMKELVEVRSSLWT